MKSGLQKIIDRVQVARPDTLSPSDKLKTMPAHFPAQVETARLRLHRITDGDLKRASMKWGAEVQSGHTVNLIQGFALVKEAARRVYGYMHYDVQVEAGYYLYLGWVAEMATGEGKTLMTTLPAYARAMERRGVHIATANTYLAERDCEECRPVYEMLGLSVSFLKERVSPADKKAIYPADIVYGTGYEFGFDYLKDQLALLAQGKEELTGGFLGRLKGQERPEAMAQRDHAYVIIDEIDSVLIDEGRSPLVISGGEADASPAEVLYEYADRIAQELEVEQDFTLTVRDRKVEWTESGKAKVYERKPEQMGQFFKRPWHIYVESALAAHHFFTCDEHYVVDDDKIMIVDEYTGRRFEDRTWRNGLHQAVEAKEGVTVTDENATEASITRQRYYRMYEQLCGMTGTAQENRGELKEVYQTAVRSIPLNQPSRRQVLPERVFKDEQSKMQAVLGEIIDIHRQDRPVLVGTRTIRQSEWVAQELEQKGIWNRLLNAKQDGQEAEIISRAGEAGAVTIATNMAGRGTDIKLASEVEAAGGLHVISVERQESTRMDRQLLGRAGRKGDRGSGRLYSSLEDHIISQYAPELADQWQQLPVSENGELAGNFSNELDGLQAKIEAIHTRQRLELLSRDKWLEELRKKS